MPIKNQKVKDLYQVLQQGGADVGTEDEFNDWLFKAGDEGYQNRKELWNTLKEGGADAGETYEDFRDWLGLHPVQNNTGTQQGATSAGQTGESTTGVTPPAKMADAARNTTLTDQSPVDAVRQDTTQQGIAGVTREQAAGNPPPSPKDISDAQDFTVYNAYAEGYKNAQEGGQTAFSKAREMAQTQDYDDNGTEYNELVLARARKAEKHYLNEKAGEIARGIVDKMNEHSFDRREDLRNIYYSDEELRNTIEDMRARSGFKDYDVIMDSFIKPQIKRLLQDRFKLPEAEANRVVGGIASRRDDTERIADEREEYATVQKYLDPLVNKYIDDFEANVEKRAEALFANKPMANMSVPTAGQNDIGKMFYRNHEVDAEKVWKGLQTETDNIIKDLHGNNDFMQYMQKQAEKRGYESGDEYLQKVIQPDIMRRVEQKFMDSEIARNMPENDVEDILSRFHNSVTGMLFDIVGKSQRQRDVESAGREMTRAGLNPKVQPKWWKDIVGVVPEMAPDFWMWGGWGKIGSKAASGLMKEQIADYAAKKRITEEVAKRHLTELAARYMPERIKQNFLANMTQMGVMMGGAEGTTAAVEGVYKGEDAGTIMGKVAEKTVTGVRHGAELGGANAVLRGATGSLRGIRKGLGSAVAYAGEGGVMYGQEVAGQLMSGEGLPENNATGYMQTLLRLGFIKASGNLGHTGKRVYDFMQAPKTSIRDWYNHPSARGVLTEKDAQYLENGEGLELIDAINEMRPPSENGEADPSMITAARKYGEFMDLPFVPQETKEHVAYLLGGSAPVYKATRAEVDGTTVRTYSMDGHLIEEKEFDFPNDAEEYAAKDKGARDKNTTEEQARAINDIEGESRFADHINELYLSAQEKVAAADEENARRSQQQQKKGGNLKDRRKAQQSRPKKVEADLTDEERMAVSLVDRNALLNEAIRKMYAKEELSEDEKKVVGDYMATMNQFKASGRANELHQADYERQNGLEEGTVKRALDGHTKEEAEGMADVVEVGDGVYRTAEEQQIVEAYRQEVDGVIEKQRAIDNVAETAGKAREEGYGMEDPEELNDTKNAFDIVRQRLGDIIGEEELQRFESNPIASLQYIIENDVWSDEAKQAALAYVEASSRFDGVIDKARADMEEKVQSVRQQIESHVHQDGMIHPATLKSGDPTKPGRQVYVLSGDVKVREDGSIDTENSSKAIFVVDPATGKPESIDISEIDNMETIDTNQELAEAEQVARQEASKEAADKIDGMLPFNVNDEYTIRDKDGIDHTVTILGDNGDGTVMVSYDGSEPMAAAKEQLQQMADDKSISRTKEKMGIVDEQPATEQPAETPQGEGETTPPAAEVKEGVTTPNQETPVETPQVEQTPVVEAGVEPMPMVGEGEDAEPDFMATTPKRGHDYLYNESGIKPEAADKLVDNQIAAADKELEKVKGEEPEMGMSVTKYKREMAEWQQNVEAAQKASDYWHGVKEERSNAVKEQQLAEAQAKLEQEKAAQETTEEPVEDVQPVVEEQANTTFAVEHSVMQERQAQPKTKKDLFQQHIDEQATVDELGGLVRNEVASSHLSTDWAGALHGLGRNIGRRIELISGKDAESKYGKGVRGFYDQDSNTIFMNADYYNNDKRMRAFIAGHEISHALKTDNNPEIWDAYVDAVREAMGDEFDTKFNDTKTLYDNYYKAYNEGKPENEQLRLLSDEEVAEEVASDWAGNHILTDADAIKKVVEHAERVGADPVTMTGKILKWINDRISFLTGAKERGENVDEELTAMERAKVLWQDMYDVSTAKQNERMKEARQREATANGEAVGGDPLKTFSLSNDTNERRHQERILERNGIDPDEVESERDYDTAVAIDEVGAGGVKTEGVDTTRFSFSANTKAAGFDSYRTVSETRTTKDGKEITEEKKIPHTDAEGNVILRMKDKEGKEKIFSANNKVTADDIKDNENSSWDMMLKDSVEFGVISEEKADVIRQKLADTINLGLELGSAKNGGVKNLTDNWQWVGETVFKTVAKNGDAQYGTSIDITRVCKKNEQMIYAISERQRQQGYGVTPGQILDLYRSIEEAGFQTPCPVCYVFSRYIRNGKYANGMINGMMKYGEHLPGGNDEWTAKQWANELTRLDIMKKASEKAVNAATKDIDTIPDLIDDLWLELNKGVSEERQAEIMKAIESLDDRYRRALDVYGQVSLTNWIKSFAIQSKDNKYVLRDDVRIPRTEEEWNDFKEHALDLRLTASVYSKYPAIQRMRKSAGSAGGKEITFASDNRPGEVAIGIGRGQETDMVNYYDIAINGKTAKERANARKKAKAELKKSIAIAAKQSLRGGQRMWSWSDNIERLSADVGTNLMQMDIVGGAVQSYSKQLEGINLVSKMNAYVNGSLMARGEGYAEVAPENTKVVDGVRVTTTDIKGMARKNGKMEERVFSEAGSPVYEENGKYYTATFDDVVGIDPFSHDTEDGRHLQGLFELNGRLDKAGNIMVGMNDMHIRTVLADPRVFFVIPWHASGQSVHILQQMMNILGVDFKARNAVDYTSMQEERKMEDGGVNDRLRNLWETSKNEEEWECGIEGGIESGDGENLSEGQKRYRFLRSQIFNGNAFREHPPKPKAPNRKQMTKAKYKEKLAEYNQQMEEWKALDNELPQIKKEILADHFLKQVYDAVSKIPDKQMTNGDNQYIYPYEYWDETSTYDTAWKNNARYLEYCRRLGRRPKFSGRWDTEDEAQMNTGNFMDSKGYWKLLIDRRMYGVDGSFQGLDPVDSTGFDAHDADPRWTKDHFIVTEVADNEATRDIVQKTVERERELFGDNPAPDYEDFVLDYAEGQKRQKGKVSAIERHQESVAATDELYKAQMQAHEDKVRAQEEEKERRKAERTRFSIGGERGASEEARERLDTAREMEKEGKDERSIWLATGWEKGRDGRWRNELPDAKPKPFSMSEVKTIADVVDAPELFEAYPELKDYRVEFRKLKGDDGIVNHGKKLMTLDIKDNTDTQELPDDVREKIQDEARDWFWSGEKKTRKQFNDYLNARLEEASQRILNEKGAHTIIHELQHAIQALEGFARGGSPSEGQKRYNRLAGEVEARNASRRSDMTDRQRSMVPLSETEDVPRDDQEVRFSFGVPYQGSKNRIAEKIVDRLPKGKRFVDLFSGGGAMTHAAMLSGKYGRYHMNDINDAGQQLFLQGVRGEWDNYDRTEMTEDEFKAIKGTPEALAWSYNGLGRNLAKVDKNGRNKAAEQIRRVQKLSSLKDQAGNIDATNMDYRGVILHPGDVVYADIPYEGTDQAGYGKGKFNKPAFVSWAQAQDVPIFVSEYTMPEGWVEVDSYDVPGMKGGKRQEKLWVQEKFADQVPVKKGEEVRFSFTPMTEEEASQYKPIDEGDFGGIYDQFKGEPLKAASFLLSKRSGDALGVFHRDEIGDIDLIWGKHDEHNGLEHMIIDHIIDANDFNSVEEMINVIDDVIKNGTREKKRKSEDKVRYEKDRYIVSVRKQFRDEKGNVLYKKNWVVTAFETTRKEHEKKRPKEEAEAIRKKIFGEEKRTSPRGTLTAPPSNPEAGGVTLPPSDVSGSKDKTNSTNLQENPQDIFGNVDNNNVSDSVGLNFGTGDVEEFMTLPRVKELVKSVKVPERITSMSQAVNWTYDTLGRIRGALNDLYGEKGSQDFSAGLLSLDSTNGRKMDVDNARHSRDRVNQYLDFVQPKLYEARDNSTSDEARKFFEDQIDECNYARQWYDRAAEGDTTVLDDDKPRFSIAEDAAYLDAVDEESNRIFTKAKERFGTTDDIREAGYILPDGTMLDFSGRHQVDEGQDTSHLRGGRTVDHRDIKQLNYEADGNTETGMNVSMEDFIGRGAIRIDGNNGTINLQRKPTKEQERALRRLVQENDGYVTVEIGDGYNTEHYGEYDEGTKATKVLGDIDRYFDDGIRFSFDGATDPDAEGYDPGNMSLDEMISKGLTDLAQKNKDSVQLRIRAMQGIGGNLQKLRQAMALQRDYDRKTVDSIVRLSRLMMGSGLYKSFSPYEVSRLMGMVNRAAGKEDVTKEADKVVDLMVSHQLKELDAMLNKQLRTKASKLNSSGVEVQAGLDIEGQRMMQAMRESMDMGDQAFADYSASVQDRMASGDQVTADNAAQEWQGVQLAQQYRDDIKASKDEEKALRQSIREAEEDLQAQIAAANQLGLNKEAELRKAHREFVKETEAAIRENKLARTEGYLRLMEALGGNIGASRERAQKWRDQEKARVEEIWHNANSDLAGLPADAHTKPTKTMRAMNNYVVKGPLSPLRTFDYMLRFLGHRSVDGRGYLWKRFMMQNMKASDSEWRNVKAAHDELDAKASEVMGKKMRWSDLFDIAKKIPGVDVTFWDNSGHVTHTLTQGNMLYIYMVNKMADGRMKLRRMGITDADVENIKEKIDPRFIQLADWLQSEYLVNKRKDYNEVYERMFGAPMAAIEDYFPLKINDRDRGQQVDLNEEAFRTEARLGSTITGSVIKRTKNAQALDITNADAFDVVLEHIQDMEHWRAFAEMNRDLNTLLSYRTFRNKVMNMGSWRYGSGKELWKNFMKTCAISTGAYRPEVKDADKYITTIAKGVSAAKVSLRLYTALKQLSSYPAYFSEASAAELAKSSNPVEMHNTWNWAMENLPGFSKRWQSRQAGDTRLAKTEGDMAFLSKKHWWLKNHSLDELSAIGMTPNALVDAITVAIGSKAIYETKYKRYIKEGYTEEKAKDLALLDAWTSYNATQQSSEGAFTSGIQLDRTVQATTFTIFRNSPMGYQRRYAQAVSNIKRKMDKGYKEDSINFMAKQMEREGLSEDQARHAAERAYNRSWYKDLADMAIFGYGLQFTWALMPVIPYLLLGDDDKKKEEMMKDAALTAFTGPMEGLAGGNAVAELVNSLRRGDGWKDALSQDLLPLWSDLEQVGIHMDSDPVRAINELVSIAIQSGIGVHPQSISDHVVAALDAFNGDFGITKEFMIFLMRFLSVPQSQLDEVYLDELGMNAREASKMKVAQLARRYARYKTRRDAPLIGWMRSEGSREDAEGKYIDRFMDKYKERVKKGGDPDVNAAFDEYKEGESKEQYRVEKRLKRMAAENPKAAERAMSDWNNSLEGQIYHRYDSDSRKINKKINEHKFAEADKIKADFVNWMEKMRKQEGNK